ncbi:MAG: S8 family serine peptidase [Firmicutes bacterium]|nr:S8 family serine peptidase [Bacillota bacterium]
MAKRIIMFLLLVSIFTYTGCGGGGGGKKKQPPLLSTIQGTVTFDLSGSTSHYQTKSMSAFSKSAFFPKAAIRKTNFSPQAVPNEKIVKFRPETSHSQAEDIVAKMGGRIKKKIYGTDSTYLVTIDDQIFSKSTANPYPEVEYIEDNLIYQALAVPNDPLYKPPYNWNYKMLNMEKAWEVLKEDKIGSGEKIIVAVLDTGIAPNHEDLKDNLVSGYDCVDGDPDPSDLKNGHGTHVAGIIGAITNNQYGTAGVGWNVVKIMPIRVLDSEGKGDTLTLVEGINKAIENEGVKVINLSLGQPGKIDETLEKAINDALDANITVIAAAGNEGGAVTSPANYDPVIAVASLDHTCSRPSYSNHGPKIDFCAPGGGEPRTQHLAEWAVKTVFNTYYSGYAYMAGTSQAAPHISGLAALLYAQDPDITPDKVEERLRNYCIDLGNSGFDECYGHGLPDAYAILKNDSTPLEMANVKVFIGTSDGAIISNLQHVGASGDFTLSDLNEGTYNICAFNDSNGNNMIDPGEAYGFTQVYLPKDTLITEDKISLNNIL